MNSSFKFGCKNKDFCSYKQEKRVFYPTILVFAVEPSLKVIQISIKLAGLATSVNLSSPEAHE
jgi:hypothetical protein